MGCDRATQIHRYHDHELPPNEQAAIEAHLGECPECRELLRELEQISAALIAAPLAAMPADVTSRLRRGWERTRERSILQATGWLTAAAAAVLVGALLTGPSERGDSAARPAVWQSLAVSSPAEDREDGSDLLMAQWMADDLSSGRSGDLR